MSRRRQVGRLALVVLAPALLASPASARTTITYMGSWGQTAGETGVSDYQLMQQLFQRFEKENPDIKVEWINSSDSSKLATMIAAGTPPDVVYV